MNDQSNRDSTQQSNGHSDCGSTEESFLVNSKLARWLSLAWPRALQMLEEHRLQQRSPVRRGHGDVFYPPDVLQFIEQHMQRSNASMLQDELDAMYDARERMRRTPTNDE